MLFKLFGLQNIDVKRASCFTLLFLVLNSTAQTTATLWVVDNLTNIGGHTTQILGNPKIIETEIGTAIEFDGVDDGIVVNHNPMAGVSAFTVEIIFKPYSDGNVEQRFLHFQQDNDNRILIELRNNNNSNWSLDTFIKSGASNKTLLDYNFTHNLNSWHHAALTYQNGIMTHYVNGNKELEGNVTYQNVSSGQTSLGMRLNQVSWFKGAIRAVKITNDVVSPNDFISPQTSLGLKGARNDGDYKNQIFPNPTTAVMTLSSDKEYDIEVFDLSGKKVMTVRGNTIDMSELTSAAYFVQVYDRVEHVEKIYRVVKK